MGATLTLAKYVHSAGFCDLPAPVVHEAKRSLLNWMGVTIGASRHETVEIALRVTASMGGHPQAVIFGRSERADICQAAFVNGTGSHVFDFDDTHLDTIIHPTGPVAPAVFALAERDAHTGQELLLAFILGVEIECRIGNAVFPSHYDAGWHITSTAGVFGAAAAAARMLDCDSARVAQALGLAATQASGLREMFGTMAKPFHVGRAAQSGLFAALLAAEGFTSSMAGIEAPRGFANVLAAEHDLARLTSGLGEDFAILRNAYKPFACGIVIHPSIDGCLQLRERHGFRPEQIESVELRVNPYVLELTGKPEPQRGLEGKFSIFHSSAVALIDGAAGEEQYSDERVGDPDVIALRARIRATADPAVPAESAHVAITLRTGERNEIHIASALGSLARPMTDADLEGKFRTLVEPVLGPAGTSHLCARLWHIDELEDVRDLVRTAVPGAQPSPLQRP